MAYQRPNGGNFQRKSSGGGSNGGGSGGFQRKSSGPAGGAPASKPAAQSTGDGEPRSTKPDFAVAIVVKSEDGKYVTAKDDQNRTVYVGSAWKRFEKIDVVLKTTVEEGTRLRLFPPRDFSAESK